MATANIVSRVGGLDRLSNVGTGNNIGRVLSRILKCLADLLHRNVEEVGTVGLIVNGFGLDSPSSG